MVKMGFLPDGWHTEWKEVHMVIVGPVYLCIDKVGRAEDIIHKDLSCRRQESTSTTCWKPYPSIEAAEADHWKTYQALRTLLPTD